VRKNCHAAGTAPVAALQRDMANNTIGESWQYKVQIRACLLRLNPGFQTSH